MSLTLIRRPVKKLEKRRIIRIVSARPYIVKEEAIPIQTALSSGWSTLVHIMEMIVGLILLIIGLFIYNIIYNLMGSGISTEVKTILRVVVIITGIVLLMFGVNKILSAFGINLPSLFGKGGGGTGTGTGG